MSAQPGSTRVSRRSNFFVPELFQFDPVYALKVRPALEKCKIKSSSQAFYWNGTVLVILPTNKRFEQRSGRHMAFGAELAWICVPISGRETYDYFWASCTIFRISTRSPATQ